MVRHGAGWFRLPERGLIVVRGDDRVRFLNGQLTQDIERLEAEGLGAGGYSFVLTPQGRIVADFHIGLLDGEVWLECDRARVEPAIARLDRFLVADDVSLHDESAQVARFGVEGPRAPDLFPSHLDLAPGHIAEEQVAGVTVQIGAFGWSGFPARQVFAPVDAAEEVERALLERGLQHGVVPAPDSALESLRVEAGIAGSAELDEEVLPAETGRLAEAVSFEKGCYTGQEVVARMASRDRMAHRLVGVRVDSGAPPLREGEDLSSGDRRVGEVSSAVVSSRFGPIALAFVRNAHSTSGTRLVRSDGGSEATVCALPFRPTAEPSEGEAP